MYQGSIEEDEEGGEAVTEVVIGAAFEAEGATVPTGATVAGMSLCLMIS